MQVFAQSVENKNINQITEQYWKLDNKNMVRDYMDDDLHHIKPFFENFFVVREDFYPSYIFDGNYETTYKFISGKLSECQYIGYSTKENRTLKFNYDVDNRLISIVSSTRKLNLEYLHDGNKINVSDTQGYKAELSLRENIVYEFKSGKTGNFIFYHYKDKIEMIVPKKLAKLVFSYVENRLINIEILEKGERTDWLEFIYENDTMGNWIQKTIIKDNKPIAMVTRTISYK